MDVLGGGVVVAAIAIFVAGAAYTTNKSTIRRWGVLPVAPVVFCTNAFHRLHATKGQQKDGRD